MVNFKASTKDLPRMLHGYGPSFLNKTLAGKTVFTGLCSLFAHEKYSEPALFNLMTPSDLEVIFLKLRTKGSYVNLPHLPVATGTGLAFGYRIH